MRLEFETAMHELAHVVAGAAYLCKRHIPFAWVDVHVHFDGEHGEVGFQVKHTPDSVQKAVAGMMAAGPLVRLSESRLRHALKTGQYATGDELSPRDCELIHKYCTDHATLQRVVLASKFYFDDIEPERRGRIVALLRRTLQHAEPIPLDCLVDRSRIEAAFKRAKFEQPNIQFARPFGHRIEGYPYA